MGELLQRNASIASATDQTVSPCTSTITITDTGPDIYGTTSNVASGQVVIVAVNGTNYQAAVDATGNFQITGIVAADAAAADGVQIQASTDDGAGCNPTQQFVYTECKATISVAVDGPDVSGTTTNIPAGNRVSISVNGTSYAGTVDSSGNWAITGISSADAAADDGILIRANVDDGTGCTATIVFTYTSGSIDGVSDCGILLTSSSDVIPDVSAIPTINIGASWVNPETGFTVTRISDGTTSGDEGVYPTRQGWNTDKTMYILQNGQIYANGTTNYLLNTKLATSHSAWSRTDPSVRFGKYSDTLQVENISGTSSTVTPVLDQNGNTIPMDKLGDAKSDISEGNKLIAIDSGTDVNLYELTSNTSAVLLGTIDGSFTGYNGALPSPDGEYVAIVDETSPGRSMSLYTKTGSYIGLIPGCENRSQHGDWGKDDLGRSVWLSAEAETPFYYVPVSQQVVILELDEMSDDSRFGNGYITGQCWPELPGFAFATTSEDERTIAKIKVSSPFTTQRTISVPDSNGTGSTSLTGYVADTFLELWAANSGGTGEITVSPDGMQLIVDAGDDETPHLVSCQ